MGEVVAYFLGYTDRRTDFDQEPYPDDSLLLRSSLQPTADIRNELRAPNKNVPKKVDQVDRSRTENAHATDALIGSIVSVAGLAGSRALHADPDRGDTSLRGSPE